MINTKLEIELVFDKNTDTPVKLKLTMQEARELYNELGELFAQNPSPWIIRTPSTTPFTLSEVKSGN